LGRNFGKKAKIKFKNSKISDSRGFQSPEVIFKKRKERRSKNRQTFISGFQFVAKNVEE
jgi:hypothetical protein